MGERITGYVPFGEFRPDLRYLANDGLVICKNVVPVYGNYVSSPVLERISAAIGTVGEFSWGLHVHKQTGNGYYAHGADLIEITEAGTVTNRTRTAASNYASGVDGGWTGASYGTFPIMCPFSVNSAPERIQYLASGAARFANMITSTFEPRARYAFPLRNNLFLANCYLAAPYDTLAAGYHPSLVAWSRNDNIQQFGSQNADPQIIGSDYQPLNFDIGEITGAIAGADCGIIAHTNGIVRVDGPPYTFAVVARNTGTVYPYSMVAADRDIYLVGPGGLTRLRGGEGPAEVIGQGKFLRSLIDTSTTNFSSIALYPTTAIPDYFNVSCAYDAVNNLIFIAYRPNVGVGTIIAVYNITEDRLSISYLSTTLSSTETLHYVYFLRDGRVGVDWLPGRDMRFINPTINDGSGLKYYSRFAANLAGTLGVNSASPVLGRGYMRLSDKQVTRFTKIRPVYAVTDQAAIEKVTVTIESTNKPYGVPIVSGPYSAVNSHGFIVTPTTVFADFSAPKFTITANPDLGTIVEYEGFEYEAEIGGTYAA